MKLGCGASLIFRGPSASGKSSRSNCLLKLGREHNSKSGGDIEKLIEICEIYYTGGRNSAKYTCKQICVCVDAGYQFVLIVLDNDGDVNFVTELDNDLNWIVETVQNKHPEHKIQVVNTTHIPSLLQSFELANKAAENWVNSWVTFKDLNSGISDVKNLLKVSTDFFQHLTAFSREGDDDDEEKMRIVQLYLNNVDFSGQENFSKLELRIKEYIQYLYNLFFSYASCQLIPEIISLILQY
jgi:hypothetical protein